MVFCNSRDLGKRKGPLFDSPPGLRRRGTLTFLFFWQIKEGKFGEQSGDIKV